MYSHLIISFIWFLNNSCNLNLMQFYKFLSISLPFRLHTNLYLHWSHWVLVVILLFYIFQWHHVLLYFLSSPFDNLPIFHDYKYLLLKLRANDMPSIPFNEPGYHLFLSLIYETNFKTAILVLINSLILLFLSLWEQILHSI